MGHGESHLNFLLPCTGPEWGLSSMVGKGGGEGKEGREEVGLIGPVSSAGPCGVELASGPSVV